tara:strand:+ start:52 stop:228 length:177 start_codon:yes stop_codon:yes gene_type:complete
MDKEQEEQFYSSMDIEKLDLQNIIEIEQIRKLLIGHPDLLAMFEIMCIIINKRLEETQ